MVEVLGARSRRSNLHEAGYLWKTLLQAPSSVRCSSPALRDVG